MSNPKKNAEKCETRMLQVSSLRVQKRHGWWRRPTDALWFICSPLCTGYSSIPPKDSSPTAVFDTDHTISLVSYQISFLPVLDSNLRQMRSLIVLVGRLLVFTTQTPLDLRCGSKMLPVRWCQMKAVMKWPSMGTSMHSHLRWRSRWTSWRIWSPNKKKKIQKISSPPRAEIFLRNPRSTTASLAQRSVGTAERSWVADAWASFWKIIRDNSTMVFLCLCVLPASPTLNDYFKSFICLLYCRWKITTTSNISIVSVWWISKIDHALE